MIAWTRQTPQVWDELQSTGSYHVREAYIRSKNGPISDYYLELYRWYTLRCRSYLTIPEGLAGSMRMDRILIMASQLAREPVPTPKKRLIMTGMIRVVRMSGIMEAPVEVSMARLSL